MKRIVTRMTAFIGVLGVSTALAFAQGGYTDDLYQDRTTVKTSKNNKKSTTTTTTKQQVTTVTTTSTEWKPAIFSGSEIAETSAAQVAGGMPATWNPARVAGISQTPSIGDNNINLSEMKQKAVESGELIVGYDEALQRRLAAYKSYKEMDNAFWDLMEGYHKVLTNKYDMDLYSVITFGNDMWVEPKYITALFDGSNPASGVMSKELQLNTNRSVVSTTNVTINVIDSPWDYYYWNRRYYDPWRWGFNWNSRYGWGFYWGYNDPWHYYDPWYYRPGYYYPPGYWGGGWGPGYRPPYYPPRPPYYPPYHRPTHNGRPVIYGNHQYGSGGGKPAGSIRPGTGTGSTRPGTSTGYRRNDNGTNVSIRPGGSNNNYQRPSSGSNNSGSGGTSVNNSRPTQSGSGGTVNQPTNRDYRRQTTTTTTTTQPRNNNSTTTTTNTPAYRPSSAPSQSSGSSSRSSGGGSSSSGGGARRR